MEWVSVEERLPEERQGCLITDGDTVSCGTFGMFCDKPHWFGCGFGGYEWEYDFKDEEVTHWMPLPEPPGRK